MRTLLAVLLLGTIGGTALPSSSDTLYTYDLTKLAKADANNIAFRRSAWDEMQLVAAVQGLVNREKPQLYVYMVGENGKIDKYWLDKLKAKGEWLEDMDLKPIDDPVALVSLFLEKIRGAVVWDERVPATSNVASTIAGADGFLPVRYDTSANSLYQKLIVSPDGPKLPVRISLIAKDGSPLFTGKGKIPGTQLESTGSAKCDAYLWAAEKYLKSKRSNPLHLAYYPDAYWITKDLHIQSDRALLVNHDYFISHKAFFFDLSPWDDEAPDDDKGQPVGADGRTLLAILRVAYDASGGKIINVGGFTPWDQKYTDFTGGKHGGVETEWRYAEILSCFNAYMDADAPGLHAMANASVYSLYPQAKVYKQKNLPLEMMLRGNGWVDSAGHVTNKTFITIYVGDYDSAAWLYQRIPDIWDDPVRGSIPLGWAFNPSLDERFPVGLVYTRKTASKNDTFVAGDSGAGYLNPGYLVPPRKWSNLVSGLDEWEKHCAEAYRKWDIGITGFVIDGNAPGMNDEVKQAYARFSPVGVVAQKIPEMSLVDDVPFLRMGSDLAGTADQGAETIANSAPKIGPGFAIYRTILWSPSGHKAMFDKLKQLRPDIVIVEPYTLFTLLKRYLEDQKK